MLKLRSPSPISSGVSRGLAAISPHSDTGLRSRSAASVANCTRRSTAGCNGSYSPAVTLPEMLRLPRSHEQQLTHRLSFHDCL